MKWADQTAEWKRKRRREILQERRETQEKIDAANNSLKGTLPDWPQPRFLSPYFEELVGRDIAERPLHGVPSIYRTEAESLSNIALEQLHRSEAALAVHVSRKTKYLSPADREAIARNRRERRRGV